MKRVTLVCTHPQQYSGYAKVGYNILKKLKLEGYELNVYAIQRGTTSDDFRNDINSEINVHDVGPNESGFNFSGLPEFLKLTRTDTLIIYNDAYVISMYLHHIMQNIKMLRKLRIIAYFDQVYEYTNPKYIENFNKHLDSVIVFSELWKSIIVSQGLTIPVYVMPHGVDEEKVVKEQACEKLGLNPQGLYLLNLNTNQVRKRYDIFAMGVAQYFRDNPDSELKIVLPIFEKESFNFEEIFNNELKDSDIHYSNVVIPFEAHKMSDREVNLMYNACDIGINTCDGEGYGLCNIEHGSLGKPQIVSNVGHFKETDFFKLNSVCTYYVDNNRDAIGGKATIVSPNSVAKAIEYFVNNPKSRNVEYNSPKWDVSVLEKIILNDSI